MLHIGGKRTFVALLTVIVMVLAGCGGTDSDPPGTTNSAAPSGTGAASNEQQSSNQSSPTDAVRVGVLVPKSGSYSDYGLGAEAGIQFITEKINQAGGIQSLGGAKIELVIADNGSDPTRTANEARRLITEENVAMILGPVSTPEAQASAPVTEQYGVTSVGLETTGVWGDNYFYTLTIMAETMGSTYADFIHWLAIEKGQDIQDIVVTFTNNDYGKTNSSAAVARLQELGYNIMEEIPVDPQVQDFTPILLRVKDLDPDVVLSVVYTRDGILLNEARYNLNYNDPLFIGGSGGYTVPQVWDQLGDDVARATLANRLFGLALFSPAAQLEPMQALVSEANQSNLGVPLDQHFIIGAQAARVMQHALEDAASTDREAINEAMKALKIPQGHEHHYMPTMPNGVAFENGAPVDASGIMIQWSDDGEQELVYPAGIATAEPDDLD